MNQTDNQQNPPSEDRYSRQMRFAPIGADGQQRLTESCVTIIGCGALGSRLAESLTRAGVGRLNLVDRDYIELSNLQRQMLFDEDDIAQNLPKAEAAARKLRKMNSLVTVTPYVADANHETIEIFTDQVDLILDGTDNLLTRYLINDLAVKRNIPWIYGACLAATGMAMVVGPGGKPCLRCVFDTPPEPGQLETCQTAGIIGPVADMVAAFQATEALKLLTHNTSAINRSLVIFEPWINRFHQMPVGELGEGCPCCGEKNFEFLKGKASLSTIALCGRNTVQVRPRLKGKKVDLKKLSSRLEGSGQINLSEFMIRLNLPDYEITIFPDSRAIIKGTEDIDTARSLYARYVGH